MYRATVTCDLCGHRQTMERLLDVAEVRHCICHRCEAPLKVEITEADVWGAPVRRTPAASPLVEWWGRR